MNNFLENLALYVEQHTIDLPTAVKLNYLTDETGISLYLEPGGQVVTEFMDGMRDISLTFTFAVQDNDMARAGQTIWQINNALSDFDIDVPSTDGSYQFNKIKLEKPYLSDQDEHGFMVYMLSGTAYLTTGGNK
ncbi:phage tail terminator protein [Leuconostoc pseudomesenteroides]|uniref:phage tail terminator protein n=1 Tax=Leuconostoc pseudomesenteroides TaxID=33968 RepID=UPI00403DE45C